MKFWGDDRDSKTASIVMGGIMVCMSMLMYTIIVVEGM